MHENPKAAATPSSRWVLRIGYALILPTCFALGLTFGPSLHRAYRSMTHSAVTQGEFGELFARAGSDVVLFATEDCPFCQMARELLAKRQIRYAEFRIDASPEAERAFKEHGGIGVPLMMIGNRRIAGFDEQAIVEALLQLDTGRR